MRKREDNILLLLPGAEISLIAESFRFLNDLLLPFLSILDESCPIFNEENIKNIKKSGWEDVDWTALAQKMDKWRDVVNAVMYIWFP